MNRRTFLTAASLAAMLLPQTVVGDDDLLRCGGMEGPFAGGLAAGWVNNGYGANDVVFAEEARDIHGGQSAQRVTCTKFVSGGVQLHSADVAVERGKPYTVRLWMKGDVASPIYVGIRKYGEPYTGYLTRHARVKNEWRPYILAGEASDTDPRSAIFIMFADTGTLWVDDVTLLPGIHEEVGAAEMPPHKGNRIFNSGFEAGSEGWTPTDGFVVDDTTAHSGRYSARLGTVDLPSITLPLNRPLAATTRPRTAPPGLECRPFPVRAGMRYTLSAWLKAAEPNTPVTLRFFEWADEGGDQPSPRNERSANVTATTDWTRCQVSGIVLPNMWEDYVARIVPRGTIWLDDIQIEEGDASDYRPAHALEVGAETPTRWCRVGERVEVTTHVASAETWQNCPLTYTLEDLWSRPVEVISRTVEFGTPDHVGFTPDKPGMYRVRVRASDSPATGEVWFGVFPHRDRELRPDSAFGTHVTAVVPEPTNTLLASEAMVRAGCGCMISAISVTGVWSSRKRAGSSGRTPRSTTCEDAVLPSWPTWAIRRSGPVGRIPRHRTTAVGPVRHRVTSPSGRTTFSRRSNTSATASDTGRYGTNRVGLVSSAAHPRNTQSCSRSPTAPSGADPQAVVIGGCFSSHAAEWTNGVLAHNGLDFMDALSYHVYWSPAVTEPATPGEPTFIEREVQQFVELMRERGQLKPIYMTEGGLRCPPFASWLPREGFSRGAAFGSKAGESRR